MPDISPLTKSKLAIINAIHRRLAYEDTHDIDGHTPILNKLRDMDKETDYIEPWHLLDKPVREINVGRNYIHDFRVKCGVCIDHDNTEMLRFLLLDTKTGDQYRYAFNCSWIAEEQRQNWLATVLTTHYADALTNAKINQTQRTKEALNHFLSTVDMLK